MDTKPDMTPDEEAVVRAIPEHFRLNLPHRMKDVLERVVERRINPKTGSPESIADIVVEITVEERRKTKEERHQLAEPATSSAPHYREPNTIEVRNAEGEFEPLTDFGGGARSKELHDQVFGDQANTDATGDDE